MRRFLAVTGVASALAMTGCHAVSLNTRPLTFRDREPPNPGLFEVDWRVKLVSPKLLEINPREPASPAVDSDTGQVFAATRDGWVRAVSPTGQEQWKFETPDPFVAGPTVKDGVVYVPGGDGFLYALKAQDGSVIWKYDTGEQLATAPLVTENRIYVASQSNTLFAVDRQSGKWLWQYRRDMPAGFVIKGASAPILSEGSLYIGFADGYVVSLDPESGSAKWEKALSTNDHEFLDVDATPIVDDAGRLIVASYRSGVFALNPENGDITWNAELAGVTGTLERADVIFTSGDSGLSAVLADNGRHLWKLPLKDRAAHQPVFVRGMLITPVNNSLLFVDPTTGLARFNWDPGQGVSAPPTWAQQRLYVLSNLGWLYALRMTTGTGG